MRLETLSGPLVAVLVGLAEPAHGLALVLDRADADLAEVADGVLGLGETEIGRLLRPEEGLGVRLRQHARRADQVPGCQGEAGLAVVLLRGDVCEGQCDRRARDAL